MASRMGAWTHDEKDFMLKNCDTMSYEDIAKELNRTCRSVKTYIQKKLGRRVKDKSKKVTAITSGTELEKTILWRELKQEFSHEELELFIFHWNRIVAQFKDDVFPTEELQIIDMIKLEILMGRAMKSEHEARKKILEFQDDIDDEKKQPEEFRNLEKINNLEHQIGVNKAAYESIHKEYANLLQRKVQMLEGLKATRSERIKRIEDSRQTFMGWIHELLNNTHMRKELGLYIEKFRIAVNVEEARLMEPHTYLDNEQDLPILTAESVAKLEKKEGQE